MVAGWGAGGGECGGGKVEKLGERGKGIKNYTVVVTK